MPHYGKASYSGESLTLSNSLISVGVHRRESGWGWVEICTPNGECLGVLEHLGETMVLGGAGNAAANLQSLGGRAILAGIFLFFALMGNVMGKVRRNFYIGVRVPWTLASERVWNDTHRLAAWVMTSAGVAGFLAILFGAPIWAGFVLLFVPMFIPIVYSFLHYKALERSGQLEA